MRHHRHDYTISPRDTVIIHSFSTITIPSSTSTIPHPHPHLHRHPHLILSPCNVCSALSEYRKHGRTGVFCVEELLLSIARGDGDGDGASLTSHERRAVVKVLDRLIQEETSLRKALLARGLNESQIRSCRRSAADPPLCAVCQQYCFMSRIRCRCAARNTCLRHAMRV